VGLNVPPHSKIGQFSEQSYWAAQVGDEWYSEVDGHSWSELLVSGLWLHISALWLFGPKMSDAIPPGNIGTLLFSQEAGVLPFQCRAEGNQCIARVDQGTGQVTLFLWNSRERKMHCRDTTLTALATGGSL
jgi:hypothetical protein